VLGGIISILTTCLVLIYFCAQIFALKNASYNITSQIKTISNEGYEVSALISSLGEE
jgi:hypothetical protein